MKKANFQRLLPLVKNFRGKKLYVFGIMILFWTIFDSLVTYVVPIALTSHFSKTATGFIIGLSSVFGALFDIFISLYVKDTNYRRLLFWMFIACFAVPLLLIVGGSALIYILAMFVWGVYYDLYNFGTFDFVARTAQKDEYSSSFGLIEVFKGFSNIIAPLIAGFLVFDVLTTKMFSAIYVFLVVGFLVFLALLRFNKKKEIEHKSGFVEKVSPARNFLVERHLWKKIGLKIWSVLLMTTFLNMILSFFWTLGPLYSEVSNFGNFNGAFLLAFVVPSLLLGWFVAPLNRVIGKKLTAFWATLFGSALLLLLFFDFSHGWPGVLIVFAASCFFAVSFPSIAAAYEDYIYENSLAQPEIQSIQDFFTNLGFILGPISAGILADLSGISSAFGFLGVLGLILMTLFLVLTARHIRIGIRQKDFEL
ncbi:MAG: MFS transporter [Candidatus Falkowbacteria bacterium]|nr:MFS transporter [Candidatus Falkowbacteria bacterium]